MLVEYTKKGKRRDIQIGIQILEDIQIGIQILEDIQIGIQILFLQVQGGVLNAKEYSFGGKRFRCHTLTKQQLISALKVNFC